MSNRDLNADCDDAMNYMVRHCSKWAAGEWWRRLRAQFDTEAAFEQYRFLVEQKIVDERPDCPLNQSNPWRTYDHHPVQAVAKLRAMAILAHVTDTQLSECISRQCHYGTGWEIEDSAPRVCLDHVLKWIRVYHGFKCLCCERVKASREDWGDLEENDFGTQSPFRTDDLDDTPMHQWLQPGWCDACIGQARSTLVGRQRKADARERLFKAEMRRAAARRVHVDEQRTAERQKHAEQLAAAKRLKRIQMEAAYELVRDLGLLDKLPTEGDDDETRTTH